MIFPHIPSGVSTQGSSFGSEKMSGSTSAINCSDISSISDCLFLPNSLRIYDIKTKLRKEKRIRPSMIVTLHTFGIEARFSCRASCSSSSISSSALLILFLLFRFLLLSYWELASSSCYGWLSSFCSSEIISQLGRFSCSSQSVRDSMLRSQKTENVKPMYFFLILPQPGELSI